MGLHDLMMRRSLWLMVWAFLSTLFVTYGAGISSSRDEQLQLTVRDLQLLQRELSSLEEEARALDQERRDLDVDLNSDLMQRSLDTRDLELELQRRGKIWNKIKAFFHKAAGHVQKAVAWGMAHKDQIMNGIQKVQALTGGSKK